MQLRLTEYTVQNKKYGGGVIRGLIKKLDVKFSTDNEGRANCRAAMSTSKKCKHIFSRK